jgi:hypothetical protein
MSTRRKKAIRSRTTRTARGPKPAAARNRGWFHDLGVMRVFLVLLVLIEIVGAPRPGTPPVYAGAEIWQTVLAPTFAPIVFMVVMLDALMGRVMLGSARGAERERYRRIVIVNLVAGIALFLWWVPYFAAIAR